MFENVRIILVEPQHPGNIGAGARAMKNMGFNDLWLVNPKRFPDPQADWRAAGATDLLERSRVASTLNEAIADCQLVIGTSARGRNIPRPSIFAKELPGLISRHPADLKVAILFGREDSGLTNDELQLCHYHLQIPSDEGYPVLNVAMALQIVVYELFISTFFNFSNVSNIFCFTTVRDSVNVPSTSQMSPLILLDNNAFSALIKSF